MTMLNSKPTVLHVLHDHGGGTAKHVVELSALLGNNINSLIIMPVNTNGKKLLSICSVKSSDLQLNLKIDEKEAYQVLAQLNISLIHIHHLIGQISSTFLLLNQNLGIPFYLTVHDYTFVCPQINFVNSWGKYCNESTNTTTCNNCLSVGNQFKCKDIDAWRKEFAFIFNKAAKVICPSIDTLLKIKKYHPTANYIVAAHDQIDNTLVAVPNIKPGDTLRIAVLGTITYIKGNKVVEQLVKLAREYRAKLHITIIGQVVGGVVIKPDEYYKETGAYNDANLLKIIDSVNPHVILFTAICPETYSYTLSTAIESQRPIITPDFGAFPERVSGRAWTWVFKHTDPVEQLFNLLNKIREENFYKQLAPKAYTFNTTEKITVNFYANGYLNDCHMTQDQILFKKYLSTQFSGLTDPIGVNYLDYVLNDTPWFNDTIDYPTKTPNEEYFEWLELLKSVDDAKNNFVFVELGAGYGKWSARAYKACLLNNISNIKLIVVEGEPQHNQWLREHLKYNNVPNDCIIFKDALISNYDGTGEIVVTNGIKLNVPLFPTYQNNLNLIRSQTPKYWYGQYHVPSAKKEDVLTRDTYLGKELLVDRHGIGRVVCDTITIETLLKTIPIVDLLNMDIQGSEYVSIHKNLEVINTKVKKLYVSTHSTKIDNLLYNMMASQNWKCIHTYPYQFQGDTEYGYMKFGDGVQVWENPKYFEE